MKAILLRARYWLLSSVNAESLVESIRVFFQYSKTSNMDNYRNKYFDLDKIDRSMPDMIPYVMFTMFLIFFIIVIKLICYSVRKQREMQGKMNRCYTIQIDDEKALIPQPNFYGTKR